MKMCKFTVMNGPQHPVTTMRSDEKDRDIIPQLKFAGAELPIGDLHLLIHATKNNDDPNYPSCFGKSAHHFKLVKAPTIEGLVYSSTYDLAWDSDQIGAGYKPKPYYTGTIKPTISGPSCRYTLHLHLPGEPTTYTRLIHHANGKDEFQFEFFRGVMSDPSDWDKKKAYWQLTRRESHSRLRQKTRKTRTRRRARARIRQA